MWFLRFMAVLLSFAPFILKSQDFVSFVPIPERVEEFKDYDILKNNKIADESLKFLYQEKNILYSAAEQQQTFHRLAFKAETDKSVEDINTIYVTFNPSYEEIFFHEIVIFRHDGTKVTLGKEQVKIKIIHKESSLDSKIFTGAKQLVMFIPHLEKGDALLYSYTIKGSNPLYHRHLLKIFRIDYSIPIALQRYSVMFPKSLKLIEKSINSDLKFEKSSKSGMNYWYLVQKDITPKSIHQSHPKDKPFYGYIDISTFNSWNEVARDAEKYYKIPKDMGSELEAIVSRIKKNNSSTIDRYLASVKFVQEKIHYLGLEWGALATKPSTPEKVIKEKYGDCKAKVLLLKTILNAMEIGSYPAYVDSDLSHLNRVPTPYAFDHVILQMKIGKKTFWVDPTRRFQKYSKPESIYIHDFRKALVIGSREKKAMTPMNLDYLVNNGFKNDISFDLRTISEKSRIYFHYKMYGSYADYWRGFQSELSKKELKDKVLNIISRDDILAAEKTMESLTLKDCKLENCMDITFALRRRVWDFKHAGSSNKLSIVLDWISNDLPQEVQKKDLVAGKFHSFSSKLTITSILTLKFDHKPHINIDNISSQNPNYKLDVTAQVKGNNFQLAYNFSSQKKSLSSLDYQAYQEDLNKIKDIQKLTYHSMNSKNISKSQSLLDEFLDQ